MYRFLLVHGSTVAFSSFLLGSALGWSSTVQPQLQSVLESYQKNNSYWYISLDDDQMSWVGSLLNIGAIFGAITGGFLMDTLGCRFILVAISVPFITGWLMISLSVKSSQLAPTLDSDWIANRSTKTNLFYSGMLYIGRILVGYCGGVCSAIAPCYIGTNSKMYAHYN